MSVDESPSAADPVGTIDLVGADTTQLEGNYAGSTAAFELAGSTCQEQIRNAVVGLLENNRSCEERRWSPRVSYVRPAWACFRQSRHPQRYRDCATLVAMTDISFEGAGILAWREIPVRHIVLQLAGVCLECDVRWSRRFGHNMYRYGLHFVGLVESVESGWAEGAGGAS